MKVSLPIVLEELCDYSGKTEVELPEEEYRKLCRKYGIYGFDWYFVGAGIIKHFDGRTWNYVRV